MADFSAPHCFTAFTFLVLFFKIVASNPISSFSFTDFDKDLKVESNVALFGGSKVVNNGGSAVKLFGSESHGGVMYKKPIKLIGGKPSLAKPLLNLEIPNYMGNFLGDGFVKMEQMKMKMAREIESMRMEMEMEMKPTEVILESQERL